jgi:hypothetical protein
MREMLPLFFAEPSDLPPSIMPVIILGGSDYEMGYQYGQQVGQYIEWNKNDVWAWAIKAFGNREKLQHALKAHQFYIKKYAFDAIEQMKGMAAGATAAGYKVSYTDILLINNRGIDVPTPKFTYPSGAEENKLPPEGCSIWSAWGSTTKDGRLICGNSDDRVFKPQVTIVAFPNHGNNYLCLAVAGEVANDLAMNNKGVCLGLSGGDTIGDTHNGFGISPTCMLFQLVRFANSASHAKDMVLPWEQQKGTSLHISDVNGEAFVVEQTHAIKSVRKTGDFGETNFIYSSNNYFISDMKDIIKGERFIEHAGWIGGRHWSWTSIPRNLQMRDMLANYQGKVDLNFAKMMWRFPGKEPPDPFGSLKAYSDTRGKGWEQVICNLNSGRVGIALPDNGDKGVAYVCTGPAGRVVYPFWPGTNWYQIAGTHTFYQLTLASSPRVVVERAMNEANQSVAQAYHKLMGLNYTDVGFSALNEIFSEATADYYRGVTSYNKACLLEGSDALLHYGKAATSFTRSQAKAKQIFSALVPPPTKPEDLGLKPYTASSYER